MRPTLRPRNVCRDCGYGWYPRGHNVARRCPNCGSGRVRVSYAGCVTVLVAIAALSWWSWSRDEGPTAEAPRDRRTPSASIATPSGRGASPAGQPAARPATLCGSPEAVGDAARASDWPEWRCQGEAEATRWADCLPRAAYAPEAGQGCPGVERCCPPASTAAPAPVPADLEPFLLPASDSERR